MHITDICFIKNRKVTVKLFWTNVSVKVALTTGFVKAYSSMTKNCTFLSQLFNIK